MLISSLLFVVMGGIDRFHSMLSNIIFFIWLLRRGAIVTTFIVCYALTSFISGYVSGGMYSRNGGTYFFKRI